MEEGTGQPASGARPAPASADDTAEPTPRWAATLPTLHAALARRGQPDLDVRTVAAAVLLAAMLGRLVLRDGGRFPPDVYPVLWLALAGPNQSGVLMGALLAVGLGMAVALRGWLRVVGALLAVAGASGTWLSGSRGSIVTAVIGAAALLVAARPTPRRAGARPGATDQVRPQQPPARHRREPGGRGCGDRAVRVDRRS